MKQQRRHIHVVGRILALAVVGRAMHRAIKTPVLLLPREQAFAMGAPPRERDKSAIAVDDKEFALAEGLDLTRCIVADIAAGDLPDAFGGEGARFGIECLDLIAMPIGIE